MTPAQQDKMQQEVNDAFAKKVQENLVTLKKNFYQINVKVEEGGKTPFKVNKTDAGFDLYATEDINILPGQVRKTPLNIRLELPKSTWANVVSKSGLGAKGLLVYAGVIDQEYRGIVHVIMSNINVIQGLDSDGFPLMNTDPIVIKKGEKCAQLIMSPYTDQYYMNEVEELDLNTARGTGGFGSTGK